MTSSLLRLFAVIVIVVVSGCGEALSEPTVTFSQDATLEYRGSTWVFISAVDTAPSFGAETRYSFRVVDSSGTFIKTKQTQEVVFESPPKRIEIPLGPGAPVTAGTTVDLELRYVGFGWDGVTDYTAAVKWQKYSFTFR